MKKLILLFACIVLQLKVDAQNCGNITIADIVSLETEINGDLNQKIINTYWHVVRTNNGELQNDVSYFENLITETKTIFESHSIFLRSCNLNEGSEIYFDDSDELYSTDEVGDICNFDSFCFEDGLNVFLIESEGILGAASIRGNKCFINVTDIESSVPVICHEIGHVFGLFHVSGGRPQSHQKVGGTVAWQCDDQDGVNAARNRFTTCDGNSFTRFFPFELVDGSNGGTSGDFVQDTPADIDLNMSLCDDSPYTNCNLNEVNCSGLEDDQRKDPACNELSPDWFNYMKTATGINSSRCFNHFSTGQVSRMHGVIEMFLDFMILPEFPTPNIPCTLCWEGDDSDPCLPCTTLEENEILITNVNNTLNENIVHGEVIVTSGATLIIDNAIVFTPNSKISVKPGAKLIVEGNGLLTKCPDAEYWQGIVIEGLNNYILGTGTGGEVEIRNGGTVEYAKIGVNKVNQISNQFGNLQSTTSSNAGKLIISSAGTVQNCEVGVKLNSVGATFGFGPGIESSTIDDAFFMDNETAIQLNYNHGITLNRNTFQYNSYGIEATNSSANVYDNNFEDDGVSIMINALYPSISGFNIERNVFTYGFAIYTETLNNAEYLFINQNVSIGAPSFIHGLADYQVTSNDIIDCYRGMEYSATGSDNANLVASNSFSNNHTGVNVDGPNNMEYLFNCFENTEKADIGLGYGTSIREVQGEEIDEAANCFDNGARLQTVDDDPELTFDYWKYPQPNGNPNWDCKEPRQANAGQNFNVVEAENEITEECGSGVDIYGPYPNFLIQYRDCQDFISRNYNDEEGLQALVNSLEEEIDRLEQEVSSGQMNYWIARTLIAKYKECIDRAKKNIVTTILQNSKGDSKERAITYLSNDRDFTFNIMAYSLMMTANEYPRALAYLNTLIPSSEDEYDFIDVQTIYHEYLNNLQGFKLSTTDRSIIYDAGMKRLELAGFARKVYHILTGERISLDVPMYDDPRGNTRNAENSDNLIDIYPNPSVSNSEVMVELVSDLFSDRPLSIRIYTGQGVLIMEDKLINKRQILSISDHKGLLFVTIEREGEVIHSQKLIKL